MLKQEILRLEKGQKAAPQSTLAAAGAQAMYGSDETKKLQNQVKML